MTFGFDLSRYDDSGEDTADAVADPWAQFVVLNLEDPNCARKVARAKAIEKPWALYSWLYPGAGAASVDAVARAIDTHGVPPKGAFLDYEQNGVSAGDSAAARARRDQLGIPHVGFYTYLYLLNSQPGLAAEWEAWGPGRWIAYYPGDNSGAYPAGEIGSAQFMGSMLWQFSSSGGTRDRNVVVDETAWAAWGGAAPVENTEEESMIILSPAHCFLLLGGVKLRDFTGARDPVYGIPADAGTFANQQQLKFRYVSDFEAELLMKASQVALTPPVAGDGEAPPPVDLGPVRTAVEGLVTAAQNALAAIDTAG